MESRRRSSRRKAKVTSYNENVLGKQIDSGIGKYDHIGNPRIRLRMMQLDLETVETKTGRKIEKPVYMLELERELESMDSKIPKIASSKKKKRKTDPTTRSTGQQKTKSKTTPKRTKRAGSGELRAASMKPPKMPLMPLDVSGADVLSLSKEEKGEKKIKPTSCPNMITAIASDMGCDVISVKADGDCFFSCVSHFVDEEDSNAMEYRRVACDHMNMLDTDGRKQFMESIESKSSFDDAGFQKRIDEMRKPGVYAEVEEIFAVMSHLNLKIRIFSVDLEKRILKEFFFMLPQSEELSIESSLGDMASSESMLLVLYGNHYDLLRIRDQKKFNDVSEKLQTPNRVFRIDGDYNWIEVDTAAASAVIPVLATVVEPPTGESIESEEDIEQELEGFIVKEGLGEDIQDQEVVVEVESFPFSEDALPMQNLLMSLLERVNQMQLKQLELEKKMKTLEVHAASEIGSSVPTPLNLYLKHDSRIHDMLESEPFTVENLYAISKIITEELIELQKKLLKAEEKFDSKSKSESSIPIEIED